MCRFVRVRDAPATGHGIERTTERPTIQILLVGMDVIEDDPVQAAAHEQVRYRLE